LYIQRHYTVFKDKLIKYFFGAEFALENFVFLIFFILCTLTMLRLCAFYGDDYGGIISSVHSRSLKYVIGDPKSSVRSIIGSEAAKCLS